MIFTFFKIFSLYFFLFLKAPWRRRSAYYPHVLREFVSPVCGIFLNNLFFITLFEDQTLFMCNYLSVEITITWYN